MPIIPPNPILPNVDYRYDGLYQSMALVLLQRIVDASGGGGANPQLQEIIDELIELNGKAATEATLAKIEAITAQMTFTGNELNVNASVEGMSTEVTLNEVLLFNKRIENSLNSLIEEQRTTNKYLRKIYNPD